MGGRAFEGISLLFGVTSGNLGNFMGDLTDWSPELNGLALEERPSSSSSSRSSNQTAIGAELWQRAEEATQGIIAHVQPTVVSENRRKEVIDYVQRLIKTRLGCEVSKPIHTFTYVYICSYMFVCIKVVYIFI